jgi:hypothetical protein
MKNIVLQSKLVVTTTKGKNISKFNAVILNKPLNKIKYFSKNYHHMTFKEPTLYDALLPP